MSEFLLPYPNRLSESRKALEKWLNMAFHAIRQNYETLNSLAAVSAGDVNLTAGMMAYFETPTPATDGATTTFYTAYKYRPGSLAVYRDEAVANDMTESSPSGKQFTLTNAPDADETLRVCYIKAV